MKWKFYKWRMNYSYGVAHSSTLFLLPDRFHSVMDNVEIERKVTLMFGIYRIDFIYSTTRALFRKY